jgi:hypothetical protein
MKFGNWDTVIEVKLECTSDASGTDYDLVCAMIPGSWLYLVKIIPGTGADAPAAAFDLDIEDENDIHMLDTNSNSEAPTGGATYHSGASDMGVFPPIGTHTGMKVSVVCATLGDGNKADIYLYFTK